MAIAVKRGENRLGVGFFVEPTPTRPTVPDGLMVPPLPPLPEYATKRKNHRRDIPWPFIISLVVFASLFGGIAVAALGR